MIYINQTEIKLKLDYHPSHKSKMQKIKMQKIKTEIKIKLDMIQK